MSEGLESAVGLANSVLLQPITADQPCGKDLEDTQLLASFDAFRLFGESTPLDPQPKWADIRASALDALTQSKDFRLLAHLGTALLRTDGLPAFAETLSIASEWLTTYWAQVYPQVDGTPNFRRNALNNFADPMAVLDGLRRTPLVSTRQGRFSLRDIEISSGKLQPASGEERPDEAQITAAFTAMPLEELTGIHESAKRALAAVKQIEAVMRDQAGPEAGPSFDALAAQLAAIERVLRGHVAARTHVDLPEGEGLEGDGGLQTPGGKPLGAIKSRQDAIRALDAVADYFRNTEPSSPIPLFVDRAKRLVSKDFLEVLADIAPEAVSQARAAGGLKSE
jgi:type VI secretion system protein ImpA